LFPSVYLFISLPSEYVFCSFLSVLMMLM
jgi:hypothetical protein